MNALNLPIEYPTTALPDWANRWVYVNHTGDVVPAFYADNLVWLTPPEEPLSLPQLPVDVVVLEDPYAPIEAFMWGLSGVFLGLAFIINVMQKVG